MTSAMKTFDHSSVSGKAETVVRLGVLRYCEPTYLVHEQYFEGFSPISAIGSLTCSPLVIRAVCRGPFFP